MFAARDQENLVHNHQQLAASKPLNQAPRAVPPKTPGNQYPKTPLKIPLRDENAQGGLGGTKGKAVGKQSSFITPMGAKSTRAPLGAKTTNAKAKAFQTPAPQKEEKIQTKPASTRRPKARVSHADTTRLEVHGDIDPLSLQSQVVPEPEYCPPKVPYPPYESDDFPDGCIDYTPIRGDNLMRGFQKFYWNPLDAEGNSIRAKREEEETRRVHAEQDAKILKSMEEMDWSISDVPETSKVFRDQKLEFQKRQVPSKPRQAIHSRPGTAVSRKAASALGATARPAIAQFRPTAKLPGTAKAPSFMAKSKADPRATGSLVSGQSVATAASRSTIGYTKGRVASNLMNTFKPTVAHASQPTTSSYNLVGRSSKVYPSLKATTKPLRPASTTITTMNQDLTSRSAPIIGTRKQLPTESNGINSQQEECQTFDVESYRNRQLYSVYDIALGDGLAGFGDDENLSGELRRLSLDDDDERGDGLVGRNDLRFLGVEEDEDEFVLVLNATKGEDEVVL